MDSPREEPAKRQMLARVNILIDRAFRFYTEALSPEVLGNWLWDLFRTVPRNPSTLVEVRLEWYPVEIATGIQGSWDDVEAARARR